MHNQKDNLLLQRQQKNGNQKGINILRLKVIVKLLMPIVRLLKLTLKSPITIIIERLAILFLNNMIRLLRIVIKH